MADPLLLHNTQSLFDGVSEMGLCSGAEEDLGFKQINPLARSMVVLLKNPGEGPRIPK